MFNCIICRYHEIATKGNNRNMFEKCLVDNIRHMLRPALPGCQIKRVRGRVWIAPAEGKEVFTQAEIEVVNTLLPKVFGLQSFSPAVILPVDMDVIRSRAMELLPGHFEALKSSGRRKPTFRIRARRSNKGFALSSRDIEIDLVTAAAAVLGDDAFDIDLDNADLTLGVEVRDEFSLLYFDTVDGPGGLPVGSNPRVLTLLSGGIDSPVAAWMIMKRGSATDFITFHSEPYTPPETVDKVRGIAKVLNTFQRKGRLFIVNLAPLQKMVRDFCSERMRTVLYRRAMFRIAEMIARANDCKALVTGEALGQVASQTVVNMDTINRSIDMLVLRPLVGADKLDAVKAAENIGTMKLSSVQVPDSCTVFAPSNPGTSIPAALCEQEEQKIAEYSEILEKIVANTVIEA